MRCHSVACGMASRMQLPTQLTTRNSAADHIMLWFPFRKSTVFGRAAYGDDPQAAANYPLVRITNNRTGHVFYSRTHDHSSMAVASNDLVSTHFDVPVTQEHGPSTLVVVANGIPSAPVAVTVN